MDEKVNILLVDDRPENLAAVAATLEDSDYRLVQARSGAEALKHLLQDEFAVILLDVQMPGLDGFETARLIRARNKSRHTPIIFITAISKDERYVLQGYAIGAVDYIFKPLEPDFLRSKVAVFVELFKRNREVKRQAEQLRRSEQRNRELELAELRRAGERHYRNLADAIPQIVWKANAVGEIDYFNRRFAEYTGLSADERRAELLQGVIQPDDAAKGLTCWREALKRGAEFSLEARLKRANDGAFRWHLVQVVPERNEANEIVGWIGTATDIDDRKRVESELETEKERLSVTLRSLGEGVITTDADARVVLLNEMAETMTGWRTEEAVGRPLLEVFRVEHADSPSYQSLVQRALLTGESQELNRDAVLIGRGGARHTIAKSAAPLRNRGNVIIGVVLVFRDMTDRKQLEEERLKASKLESIGVLAGSIAHDFNNILTAIMGNISLARLYAGGEQRVSERLVDAEKASLWAKDLTQQLLTFAKGGAPIKKVLAAGDMVRDAATFAATGSHCRCEVRLDDDLWTIEADEAQLRQVIHNLVLNAQQAMPNGGTISMHVSNARVTNQDGLPLHPGEYVKIRCEDRGIGIAPEHLDKIFDPYFTTKQRGSGLGLATSYSIVRRHEGLITVRSRVGDGTCFEVYLPALPGATPSADVVPAASPERDERGRILVMDDEVFIRDLLARLFTHFGYDVESVADGAEAVSLYRRALDASRRFDVVIMDLVIPGGMGGREALQKILEMDPQAKAVVSSGYSNDPIMSDYRKHGFSEAVAKPYKNDELRKVVQRLVKEGRQRPPLRVVVR